MVIRKTWLSAGSLPGPGLDFVFVVGRGDDLPRDDTTRAPAAAAGSSQRGLAGHTDGMGSRNDVDPHTRRLDLQHVLLTHGSRSSDDNVSRGTHPSPPRVDLRSILEEYDAFHDLAMLNTPEPRDADLARNILSVFQWAVHVAKQRYLFIAKVSSPPHLHPLAPGPSSTLLPPRPPSCPLPRTTTLLQSSLLVLVAASA